MQTCPTCFSVTIKRNGHIHNGKQNYRCLCCGRQFILNPEKKIISHETKSLIRQALLERISLEGICRIFDVSMSWLLQFIDRLIDDLPRDLNATIIADAKELEVVTVELDKQWSFVGNKQNKQWLWLVFHSKSRQVLTIHVGERTRESAERLLSKLPEVIKKVLFYTDKFSVYYEVISWKQHQAVEKESEKTSYIERHPQTTMF